MNAIEKAAPQQPNAETIEQANTPLVPIDLVHRAITSGADVVVLEKLMALQERWEANQARKAFDAAMASAKADIPVILKSRKVDFTSSKGRTQYRYEDLAEIARTVDPSLSQQGLSYRFRTTSLMPETIAVTCIVSHRDGHSEENTLSAGHDASGNKNSIQALGSAVTYLQRYTLKAALGLAASDDDDGQSADTKGSAASYVERWTVFLANASSADVVTMKWNDEKALRNNLDWPDSMMHARLKDAVTRRIEQLKQPDGPKT